MIKHASARVLSSITPAVLEYRLRAAGAPIDATHA
jgi:hypothetical protein